MKTLLPAASVLVVAAAQASALKGKCLLEVNGRTYIKRPCNVEISKGGDFTIKKADAYLFACIYVNGQTAEGF